MTPWLGAAFLAVAFLGLLRLFRLLEVSRRVVAVSRQSLSTIGNVELSEDEKERILQRHAVRLFVYFLLLSVAGSAAMLLPLAILWCAEQLGWLKLRTVLATAGSPGFLVGSTVLACLAMYLARRRNPAERGSAPISQASYSGPERLLHELAMNTYPLQVALGRVEDRLFKAAIRRQLAEHPVFIAGLPRAGTTLLLECCAAVPEFATHTYRDMPFVPLPCLWGRFSDRFAKTSRLRPRAHGDGMMISADSPEALEEVLWMQFWPGQYRKDRILPWQPGASNDAFREFFANHMGKVLHRRGRGPGSRYASKNNLNIARVGWLRANFPDAVLLVPFRDPVQHAASLLRQHRNFLAIHSEDPFAADYMRAIGHFEFGVNLRPIDFDGWLDARICQDPESLGFWLEYWVATYTHLLSNDCGLRFFSYETFCEGGEQGLRHLATALASQQPEALQNHRQRLHAPQCRNVDVTAVPSSVLDSAEALHLVLLARASAPAEVPDAADSPRPESWRQAAKPGGQ